MTGRVYFDLDGTLTDSQEGITRSIQFAMQRLGCDVPATAELRWCLGPPLLESFASLVGSDRAERALALYRERFTDVGWAENRLYPGITEMLEALRGAGCLLYVATSKPRVFAERILDHFALRTSFRAVFGSELDGARTDKSELLQFALEESPATGTAVMVGDRRHDIIGARNNGMRPIGVTWGYGSASELAGAGAEQLIGQPADLPPFLLATDA